MSNLQSLIVAHRGGAGLKPENTLEAFKNSVSLNIDYIEIDIRKTLDNKLVLFHDEELNGKKISSYRYQELQKINPSILLYQDFLKFIKDFEVKVDIELKEKYYEEDIIKLTLEYLPYQRFVMKSFYDYSVRKIKKIDKRIKTGLLLDYHENILIRIASFFPELRLFFSKADFVSPHYKLLDKFLFLKRMNFFKKNCFVWTVNEKVDLEKMLAWKIEAIITDYPDIALNLRKYYQ